MKFQHKLKPKGEPKGDAEPKGDFSLINTICMEVRSSLTVAQTSELMTKILLSKQLVDHLTPIRMAAIQKSENKCW